MQILNNEKQENCRMSIRLFKILSKTFKPYNNEAILSLQYCKQIRKQKENAQEGMCYLRIKANECGYKYKLKIKREIYN